MGGSYILLFWVYGLKITADYGRLQQINADYGKLQQINAN